MLGKLAKHGHDGGWDVPGAERRYDQAVDLLGYSFDESSVVAEGDGGQANLCASTRYRANGW